MPIKVYMEGQRQAIEAVNKAIRAGRSGDGLFLLVDLVTARAETYASRIAPYRTGTLRSAHRSHMVSGVAGEVYIDPTVRNLILGGFPVAYGPMVHAMGFPRNWMERTTIEGRNEVIGKAASFWSQEFLGL
jgi:hypothetical protein